MWYKINICICISDSDIYMVIHDTAVMTRAVPAQHLYSRCSLMSPKIYPEFQLQAFDLAGANFIPIMMPLIQHI